MKVIKSELLLHSHVVAKDFEVTTILVQKVLLVNLLHLLSHFQSTTVIVEESFEMAGELGQVIASLKDASFVVKDCFDEGLVDGLTRVNRIIKDLISLLQSGQRIVEAIGLHFLDGLVVD